MTQKPPAADIPWGPEHPNAWGEVVFGVARDMNPAETLTTAIYSAWLCDPAIQQVTLTPQGELSEKVKQAIEIIKRKTPGTKIQIAIEMLDSLLDKNYENRGPGLPDPDDYDEERDDPYGYITPALDEDDEDDSGLSGVDEDEDYFDPYYGDEYDHLHNNPKDD
jgi:hypothetical protein